MKKNKPIPYNFYNELPENDYKSEWRIPTKKDIKKLKKINKSREE